MTSDNNHRHHLWQHNRREGKMSSIKTIILKNLPILKWNTNIIRREPFISNIIFLLENVAIASQESWEGVKPWTMGWWAVWGGVLKSHRISKEFWSMINLSKNGRDVTNLQKQIVSQPYPERSQDIISFCNGDENVL